MKNLQQHHNIKFKKALLLMALLTCFSMYSRAQLNPFQSMYFQNRYLINPAMAGLDQGLNINLGYRQQWNTFPGSPKSQTLTADYQATDRVGLGLNITDDQSGLLRQTRAMGTYAYHLPLSDRNQKLNFGLSLGVNDGRIDMNKIVGDETDEQIARYNQAKPYVDGDFGIAYTSDNLFLEGAIPNLKAAFFKNSIERIDVDRVEFFAAASYKIYVSSGYTDLLIEPLTAYRKIKGAKDIVDAGFNFTMSNYFVSLQAIYHSNQSTGLGLVFDQKAFAFNFTYNLETGKLAGYTTGALELGLRLKLFRRDK
ncbi:type IX secretion system membrane protein PorP/SprF [Mucilaginibacter sp. SG564]|uniref:PorP/SprF family type IX secretion system membrane protein n=1 Tax=Mucilaginibacter sp. SG564 TaxID=2587022 RepID=UPI0015557DF1|nr:type IX secretion system membrane protein PorP/SprF [Mucilaginibacter sp. SG564]NOW97637.1 type IX secretion system PorP/SprF family membrane protein [Mucilaginibacter sp. SG564]